MPAGGRAVARFLVTAPGLQVLLAALLAIGILRALFADGWDPEDVAIMAGCFAFRGIGEWLVHAYVLHARPLPLVGWRLAGPLHAAHMAHHQHPDDVDGVMFKARSNLFLVLFSLLAFTMIFGDHGITLAFCGALLLLVYEIFHVLSHSATQPRPRWLRRILENHRHHHAGHEDECLGISSRLGDRLFGTDGLAGGNRGIHGL